MSRNLQQLEEQLAKHGIDWNKLTPGERFQLTREIPCWLRCWRVGVAIPCKPGDVCPECGKTQDKLTSWEKIPLAELT